MSFIHYQQAIRLPMTGPVTVPNDFMGMCFIRYPLFGANPIGVLNYGSARMSQTYGTRWADHETAPGVYDFSQLDQLITFQRTHGKSVYFGLYGTPRFYADNTTPNPEITDYNTLGAWGVLYGEGAMPTSLSALAAYVTAIIQRYNLPGGAWYDVHGSTMGKGIQAWETWNEPNFYQPGYGAGNGGTVAQPRTTRFGWQTGPQLTDLHVTQYDTIKSLDPTVLVSTPGFTGTVPNWIVSALNQVGPVTGKTMLNTCDALGWHPYLHTPIGWRLVNGRFTDPFDTGSSGVNRMRAALASTSRPNLPLWVNEWGVDDGTTSTEITQWNAAPPEYRRKWIARCFASLAALGVARFDPWHWEMTGAVTTAGNFQSDINGAQAGYNLAAEHLPGRTITSAEYLWRGEVRLKFSSGPDWVI